MRKSMTTKAAAILFVSLAMFGCKKEGAGVAGSEKSGPVIAEVNGTAITAGELTREMKNLPPQIQPMAETDEGKKELVDTMVIREIILQQAKKDGLDKSREVAERMEDLKNKVIVDTYLKKKLEEQAKVSDEELKKFYEQYKEKFKTGDQIKASHILVKSQKEADDLAAQLKGGASFEELAKKHSSDSSAAKGGDLGWFGKGNMVPEFEKVAFSLKEGQISPVVQTKFGFHIIKVTGTRKAGYMPFEEVKDQIKAAVLPEKQQEIFKKLKDDLKKGAKISIKEDALKSVKAPTPGATAEGSPEKK